MVSTVKAFGRIDGLVINHGTLSPITKLRDSDAEEWRRAYDINVFSPVALVNSASLKTDDVVFSNWSIGQRSYPRATKVKRPRHLRLVRRIPKCDCRLGSLWDVQSSSGSRLCTPSCRRAIHYHSYSRARQSRYCHAEADQRRGT
jgi:NAD(P)-dependent dehydrogenase (short-subunit alcohol dehydrogenase family)